jgi:4-hydroxybenzoate polyprenyltransferase
MSALTTRLPEYASLMRLDRPVGTLLLLWPTLAALWMGANGIPESTLIGIFALGTIVMRAGGCVINDYADRDLDKHVRRTRDRPLTAGRVTKIEALLLFALLLAIGALLVMFLDPLTRWTAVAGAIVATIYPFMKRWTYLPQVVLGVAFSWGILMAFTATRGAVPEAAWLLFVGSMLWIVAYDTMYAMVDRDDDVKAGIKSTAILFGGLDRVMVAALQIGALFAFWTCGQRLGYGWWWIASLAAIGWLFSFQHFLIRRRTRDMCFRAFRNNVWVGFALFCGAVIETLPQSN